MDKTIGACGFSATGSSSVVDFLKEFDENIVFDDFEFYLTYTPDGIEDFAYHLNEGSSRIASSNVAIHRYKRLCEVFMDRMYRATGNKFKTLTDEYLKSIIQTSWYGGGVFTDNTLYPYWTKSRVSKKMLHIFKRIHMMLEKTLHKRINKFPNRDFYFSANLENFYNITKEYIEGILLAFGKEEGKNIVLEQPFSGNDPQKSMKYFNNPKAIVVDRDPRDLYLYSKNILYDKFKRIFPADNVADFVVLYKNMRKGMPYLIPSPDILNIRFEDMVYEYEQTTKKIIDFLELKSHDRPKSFFNPKESIGNTQLSQVYPCDKKDVLYIEKELPEYLYPFEKYECVKNELGIIFS